jgi:hypothetical protein
VYAPAVFPSFVTLSVPLIGEGNMLFTPVITNVGFLLSLSLPTIASGNVLYPGKVTRVGSFYWDGNQWVPMSFKAYNGTEYTGIPYVWNSSKQSWQKMN